MPPVDLPYLGLRAAVSGKRFDKPIVVETEHLVSLCFDGRGLQSTMLRAAPDALALGYTRMMMGFLLFQPEPARVGLIGLGGGSLVKYCYRNLPNTQLTAIEINPEVIALRDRFHIPSDDARLTIVCADAAQHLSATEHAYDALLLDGFNADGAPSELCSAAFYDTCRARLNAGGVLVVNLLGDDPRLSDCLTRLRETFGPSVALAPADDSAGNLIAFAWQSDASLPPLEALIERADRYRGLHGIDLIETAARIELGASYDWTCLSTCVAI